MILVVLIVVLFLGGVAAWIVGRGNPTASRWISLVCVLFDLGLTIGFWTNSYSPQSTTRWLAETDWEWVPQLGIRFHLGLDGLSLPLLALTFFLGVVATVCSWNEITERVGFFHFNLLFILAGITGVFVALDLFLFYFFWEVMLVPMYFLIGIWGHENRNYAALKFFIFTQAASLFMLVAILALAFLHRQSTSVLTFDYESLLRTPIGGETAMLLMLGFFVAFAVKMPMFPFHPWLPDAHTEAPTAGSVILAGLLLKTGGYGILRFVIPLFPGAARAFAPIAVALAVIGILYGAVLAYGQHDLKRLVAYTSVSHLGFVLLGIFAWNDLAIQGALMQMLCHGLSTGALFMLVGGLQERIHTRDTRQMGGLWAVMPRMGGFAMFFAMASLGLPGLGNFIAEFLVLIGAYRVFPIATIFATIGLVAATAYSLAIMQRAFHGPNPQNRHPLDLDVREVAVLSTMVAALIWLGLYPQTILATFQPALDGLKQTVETSELDDDLQSWHGLPARALQRLHGQDGRATTADSGIAICGTPSLPGGLL